jgi:prolipoprotein diacylglyceryltransferase
LEDPAAWKSSAHPLVYLYASKTMVGGLLGGLAGVEITKKFLREKRSSGDLFTYPLILGIIIGRIGCFLSGINEPTYGYVTTAWTGMDLGDGLKRHPIALYEITFLIMLWIILRWCDKNRPLAEGMRFQYFMIAYLLFRWAMEWIKPHTILAAGQSAIQWACILGLIYYRKTILKIIFIPSQPTTHAR